MTDRSAGTEVMANVDVLGKTEDLLVRVADLAEALAAAQETANKELAAVRDRHQTVISRLAGYLQRAEKDLRKHVLAHREAIFAGDRDRADFKPGSVLLKVERRVRQVRTMLRALKKQGLTYAIRKTEAVDWDIVNGFDDALLTLLGTARKSKTVFSYSLKKTGGTDR